MQSDTDVATMLFNSAIFILFFFAVFIVYHLLPLKPQRYFIIAASLVFYGWYSLPFLALLAGVVLFNYLLHIPLVKNRSSLLLGTGVVVNLSLLAFFKYFYLFVQGFGFVIQNDYLMNIRDRWMSLYHFEIILPIAISFYTFQVVAFLIDCYRGTVNEKIPPDKFALFVLFFPQLLSGPIQRASDFIPQMDSPRRDSDSIINGALLIMMGIVKKVFIADHIGSYVIPIWGNPSKYDALVLLLIMPAFIIQIYCDFSGYTDMARGLGRLLGFVMPENFKGPLLAKSVGELWHRWHITLSSWLRDYLYIPLGGSRGSISRTNLNLIVTMAVAGLWHGATWPLLLWGVYMGVILSVERTLSKNGILFLPKNRFGNFIRVIITFSLFAFSAVLFAAPTIAHTFAMLKGLFTWQTGELATNMGGWVALAVVGFLFNFIQYTPNFRIWMVAHPRLRLVLLTLFFPLIWLLSTLYGDVSGTFIYFNF